MPLESQTLPDPEDHRPSPPAPFWWPLAFLVVFGLAMFTVRALGPKGIADGYHQGRAISYVMDAVCNDNWICQTGAKNDITTKPPMFTWLAAASTILLGEPGWFGVVLPSALAIILGAILMFLVGARGFNWRAGLFAGLTYLASPAGAKQIGLVRIDPLFSFSVCLTAVLAYAAWKRGRGWTWFWLAAAFSTLTKGPLGLVLGAVGLFAAWWERRSGKRVAIRGNHLPGVLLFLGLCAGWFAAAYSVMGHTLLDVMLGRELVGQLVKEQRSDGGAFLQFYLPTLYLMRAFVPWVLFTGLGVWRAFRNPATEDGARRFERFLVCWLIAGLVIFSSAAHQRPDLIFPLVPPAALLAGRELARLLASWSGKKILLTASLIALLCCGLAGAKYILLGARGADVLRTAGVRQLAEIVRSKVEPAFPLNHVDDDFLLQFYLNTKRPMISYSDAAELLKSDAAAFVVVRDMDQLRHELGSENIPLHEAASWKAPRESLHLIGNREELAWSSRMTWIWGALRFDVADIQLQETRGSVMVLKAVNAAGRILMTNRSAQELSFTAAANGQETKTTRIAPKESAALDVPAGATIRIKTAQVRNIAVGED